MHTAFEVLGSGSGAPELQKKPQSLKPTFRTSPAVSVAARCSLKHGSQNFSGPLELLCGELQERIEGLGLRG